MVEQLFNAPQLDASARKLFAAEREINRLDGWLEATAITEAVMAESNEAVVIRTAKALSKVIQEIPMDIHPEAVFAGTQRDAFARSYALINPSFRVSTFQGYCDPTAVFGDVEPNEIFTAERIEEIRRQVEQTTYVQELKKVYEEIDSDIGEVAFFVEQVTGHLIPDFRNIIAKGINTVLADVRARKAAATLPKRIEQYTAMEIALENVLLLAKRYREIAQASLATLGGDDKKRRQHLIAVLDKVPYQGAETLFEAIQAYMLLWQTMCLEQAPNPFAFSVGNADRIFEPYRAKEALSREETAGLLKHFLVFFNVGDRSWAISQNVIVGGKNERDEDLTNLTTYSFFDAYYEMNLPQPILSVKLHRNTPSELYQELGRFFFTPGVLTPSLFNDDAMFEVLKKNGVATVDLPDYSIAGCQEPLIMGKDNGNTTNTWLNLAKILELALNDGKSLLSGKQIGPTWSQLGFESNIAAVLPKIHQVFYRYVDYFLERMVKAGNGASLALSNKPVPFLSCCMGGIESGIDMRDGSEQGTRYNGSGCLIHGLAVVADSFVAIEQLLQSDKFSAENLWQALQKDFAEHEDLHKFLLEQPKFGNNIEQVDSETAAIARQVADKLGAAKNYLGNPFRPDFSTPSTHLIYGSLVGALPSGRKAKEMLNYGADPLYGEATTGLGFRILSSRVLPYDCFSGGYASHLGLDPKYFKAASYAEKGIEFRDKVVNTLFFYQNEAVDSQGEKDSDKIAPFYLYVNVTTPDILQKVLEKPEKYAPGGVYIMRIHGTFVNFLDLSPEIQQDIIKRLDLKSTAI